MAEKRNVPTDDGDGSFMVAQDDHNAALIEIASLRTMIAAVARANGNHLRLTAGEIAQAARYPVTITAGSADTHVTVGRTPLPEPMAAE